MEPLRELRTRFELSQREVAEALGMHQPVYSMIETGKTQISDEQLLTLWNSILEMGLRKGERLSDMAAYIYAASAQCPMVAA